MSTKQKIYAEKYFNNVAEDFSEFKGKIISANEMKTADLKGLNVAIIGANQLTVTHLNYVVQNAKFVKVFQMSPHFVLPQTETGLNKLISHPLIAKNRRLFNSRVKSLLAVRYLESQVAEPWMVRQLMQNTASEKKVFLKSDTYYKSLQANNCKLITWPVVQINENAVQSMEGIEHLVDVIITT